LKLAVNHSADRDVALLGATLMMSTLCSLKKCHLFEYISQTSETERCCIWILRRNYADRKIMVFRAFKAYNIKDWVKRKQQFSL